MPIQNLVARKGKTAIAGITYALALCAGFTATPAMATCEDATTTVEMGACLEKEYKRADSELNRIWGLVQSSIEASDYVPAEERETWKKVLLDAQRGWVQFKENDCFSAVPYEWYGGSGAGNAAMSCALDMTEARTKALKQRYGVE
ncbi:lysozyme inhibitor LprI family protein [Tepidamorphus sp. 3E244]|uniref:lysozyme inhibitor LprI family protein n=1 Tax=Tepidamorphus sp. 3E244 TaxID=3385498 RepID=UPI0038FC4981